MIYAYMSLNTEVQVERTPSQMIVSTLLFYLNKLIPEVKWKSLHLILAITPHYEVKILIYF